MKFKEYAKYILPNNLVAWIKKMKFRMDVLRGHYVYCPICDTSCEKFQPFGLNERENARCPNCGSLERHRLIYLFLRDNHVLFDGNGRRRALKVLHFAPEEPFYHILSNRDGIKYIPCDLNPDLYGYEGGVDLKQVDITNIPFEDDSFDFILCNHVLEHIPNDGKAMSELYRVMRPGGSGVFQVPIDYDRAETYEDSTITTPSEREKEFGRPDHVRMYGPDFKLRLEAVGFKVNDDNYVTKLPEKKVAIYRLDREELIYHCEK